jgi:hypothetical protein
MRRSLLGLLAGLALSGAMGACGKVASQTLQGAVPFHGAAARQGAIAVATKNTTRLGGADAAADAAAVAQAVYPGLTPATRPQAVVVVDEGNWPAALAAAALASAPLSAPLLYAHGKELPATTVRALRAMNPSGAPALGGVQVIRIGTTAAVPDGYRTSTVSAAGGPARAAAAVERLVRAAQGKQPGHVIVVALSAGRALQMPAAGLAAESGAPILFTDDSGLPAPTAATLARLGRPAIYLLGAPTVGAGALAALGRYGRLIRITSSEATQGSAGEGEGERDPVSNAVSVSRFSDGSFGWGIREAGHGLVFVNSSRTLDAPAAAPLSAHGDYGPLLLLSDPASVPAALAHYLSDIEPGYTATIGPVREVYNHGWLIGDESAMSPRVQAEIDAILEVAPRTSSSAAPPPPAPE